MSVSSNWRSTRLASVIHAQGRNGDDPFAKGLLVDMVNGLDKTASASSSHKTYRNKELADRNAEGI